MPERECGCEFPGTTACCRGPEQATLAIEQSESPCTDPQACGDFCFGMCQAQPVEAQCDLENPEPCEACQ